MQRAVKVVVQDYGTNCKDCERYQKLGDICMIEHGKKYQWEYCRDFTASVVLPDYKELMRSVREDRALERKKEKEKKEKEKRRKLKERQEKEELRKKKRRSMLRRRREREKKKLLRQHLRPEKVKVSTNSIAKPMKADVSKTPTKKSPALSLENSEHRVIRKPEGVAGKSSNVSDNER